MVKEYLEELGIFEDVEPGEDGSHVIDLKNSDHFGKIYSILDNSKKLEALTDHDLITEEGSSLIFQDNEEQLILNLISD